MSDESRVLVFFCVVVVVICACIQGAVTNAIIKGKGHRSNGFWWGFFLGPIGLAVAILKPYIPQVVQQPQPVVANKPENFKDLQGWKCLCGRENAYYISSCTCGRSKRDVLLPLTEKKPAQQATTVTPAKPTPQKPQTVQKPAQQATTVTPAKPTPQKPQTVQKPAVQQQKSPVVSKETTQQLPPKPAAETQPKNIEERRIAALREYKALLDSGIISQEEFNERKKHILSM